ncbi:hypothetical protein [Myxococcus sp. AB025B]|uniref:hypothetical protein n=1 Tax=Myxococcus sp. AB025B TaxID=2562794 RepID=UPI0018910200|nr:hypothetical protein [Myxococcus sp. AB025B]
MSRRLLLAILAATLCGVAAAHAHAEWRACAYLGAAAFGVLSLILFLGGACLAVAAFRRSNP